MLQGIELRSFRKALSAHTELFLTLRLFVCAREFKDFFLVSCEWVFSLHVCFVSGSQKKGVGSPGTVWLLGIKPRFSGEH